jgi:hypothetical protein
LEALKAMHENGTLKEKFNKMKQQTVKERTAATALQVSSSLSLCISLFPRFCTIFLQYEEDVHLSECIFLPPFLSLDSS